MEDIIFELKDIHKAAKEFNKNIKSEDIIAFYGSMGAGKTTFIKAVCDELGVEDIVNSPTFTIVNEYRTKKDMPIFHFDFYRIKDLKEVEDLGFEDYLYGGGISLMEWPEKIEELLPPETLKFKIEELPDLRRKISKILNQD
ncbi:MAG: tRNA (adenosine(37)-N6)-threonylcarbamoyltransferase complex ATPase subunit type 1 TsaE [Bacteroidales bacterium]